MIACSHPWTISSKSRHGDHKLLPGRPVRALVPKNASLSLNEGVLYVKHGNEEQKVHYNLSQPPTSFWVVIEGSSDPLCLCDLAAGFEFQGRHGHATCKCINCDLTATEWKPHAV